MEKLKAPKLREGDRENFNMLLQAASVGQIALVSAIRKADGKAVALVCAMSSVEGEPKSICPVPFAVMVEGNPFELFHDPTVL